MGIQYGLLVCPTLGIHVRVFDVRIAFWYC